MIDKATHDDYIKLYNELVDRNNQKEDIIQEMTNYIAKYARKNPSMCKNNKSDKCNINKCKKCVREYFENKVK